MNLELEFRKFQPRKKNPQSLSRTPLKNTILKNKGGINIKNNKTDRKDKFRVKLISNIIGFEHVAFTAIKLSKMYGHGVPHPMRPQSCLHPLKAPTESDDGGLPQGSVHHQKWGQATAAPALTQPQ